MRRRKNNKRKYTFLAIFLIADLLLIVTIFKTSNARFVSEAESKTDLSVALYAVHLDEKDDDGNVLNVNISNLEPDGIPRYYYFTVYNQTESGKITDTSMKVDVKFIATTNIPLQYAVYEDTCGGKTSALQGEPVISTDGSGSDAQFVTMITKPFEFGHEKAESKSYCLSVTFPKAYSSYEYQNLIESFQVKVETKQIME